jgi:hypothetical protein
MFDALHHPISPLSFYQEIDNKLPDVRRLSTLEKKQATQLNCCCVAGK